MPQAKLVLFVLASIVLMVTDHKYSHLEVFRSGVSTLVYPLQYTAGLAAELPWQVATALASRRALLEENTRLREEQLRLQFRLQRVAGLEDENRRLRTLLEASVELYERVQVTELIEVELEPFRKKVLINKGESHGVFVGQPLVNAGGIMGQITHTSLFSSTVLLLTDQAHSIPVLVNRNGLRAVATGLGEDNVLSLEHIPINADIREGDLIVSSGLGRKFPKGYPVGTVSGIKRDPAELFAGVTLTPSARLGMTREALLLWLEQSGARASDMAGTH